jgi:hypothetical protein
MSSAYFFGAETAKPSQTLFMVSGVGAARGARNGGGPL